MSNSTAVLTSFTSSDTVIETTTPLDTSTPAESTPTSQTILTSTTFASSIPESTELITSTQVVTPTAADGTQSPEATTVVITSTRPGTTIIGTTRQTRPQTGAQTETSTPAALANDASNGGSGGSSGLSTGATVAIAVVIPLVVVALLVGLGIFCWRKRKSKKNAAEQRQKEMEDYSYNPNGDPTLPAIGSDAGTGTQMAEDSTSGYRGWGVAAGGVASNRKQSTTLSAGNTHDMAGSGAGSDYGNNAAYGGAYNTSPHGAMSDGHSGDPLVHGGNHRSTMGSDDLADLGGAPVAGTGAAAGGIRRGPSNASSAYSAGARSDDDPPPMPPPGTAYDYNPYGAGNGAAAAAPGAGVGGAGYGYGQHGPYGDGSYGGNAQPDMPVVRDVSARRNTRIQPGGSYQQGNSGIAQNF